MPYVFENRASRKIALKKTHDEKQNPSYENKVQFREAAHQDHRREKKHSCQQSRRYRQLDLILVGKKEMTLKMTAVMP